MRILCIFALAGMLLPGCARPEEEPFNPPPPPCTTDCDSFKLELLWQVPIGDDLLDYSVGEMFVYENLLLHDWKFSNRPDDPVRARDVNNGALVWEWSDFYPSSSGNTVSDLCLYNDRLYVSSWNEVYAIHLPTGQTAWRSSVKERGGCGAPRLNVEHDLIFHSHEPCVVGIPEVHLVSWNSVLSGWDTLYSLYKNAEGIEPGLEPPAVWLAPWGDTVLVFQNRSFHPGTSALTPVDLFAFNYSADSLLWKIVDFEEDGFSAAGSPLVYQDMAYIQGKFTVYGFDLKEGKIKWKRHFPNETNFVRPLFRQGKYLIASSLYHTIAMDAATGQVLWKNEEAGAADQMIYFNNFLYFTSCNQLHVIQLNNGKSKLHLYSPNRDKYPGAGFCFEGLAIHPGLRRLYASDGYFILCYRLPGG